MTFEQFKWFFGWLCDKDMKLSATKVVAFSIFVSYVCGRNIPILVCLLLTGTCFGLSAWRTIETAITSIIGRKTQTTEAP